ncbi:MULTISPECIES: excinuclease ABC subunit B [unclassified Yoonia]|uniref:excinuclease ABC subunit B n=1 Tax=unclassified Yoonia TaxID=2629118 RepID=UPI002AFE8609|nr:MULTISPECIES: excinuclease ABC subunit B [unclassified Yoonia]
MRLTLALFLIATPAAAWEFSPAPVCTLTDDTGTLTVTYDASLPEYTVTITLPDGTWSEDATFAMNFAGNRPVFIQTDRHRISADGRSLTVADSGFGNVLNGLEFNERAYAISGDTTVGVSLDGIGPAMAAFRACPAANLA